MKKTLQETQQRIFEIMSQMDSSLLLTELNQKYLDILLDKISKGGMESLKPGEKQTTKIQDAIHEFGEELLGLQL